MLYQFTPANFATVMSQPFTIPGVTQAEMNSSGWLVYLIRASGLVYHIPGPGVDGVTQYRVWHEWTGAGAVVRVVRWQGPGEEYTTVRVLRIAAGATGNNQPATLADLLPAGLDVNDYDAVAAHFGIEPH